MIRSQNEKDKINMAFEQAEEIDNEVEDPKKPKIYSLDDLDNIPDTEYAEGFEIDEEADAFASVAPPDAGVYGFTGQLGDRGIQIKTNSLGVKYHSVSMQFTLVSENSNLMGATLYSQLSTNIGRSKGTSTLATFLNRNGLKISGAVTGKSQLAALKKFILSEAITYIEVDWEASYQDEHGKYVKTHAKQKDFKKDSQGNWIYRFEKKLGNGNIINYGARLFAVDYYGSTPEKPKKDNGASTISKKPMSGNLTSFNISSASVEDLEKEI